jgi:hypothetical protein
MHFELRVSAIACWFLNTLILTKISLWNLCVHIVSHGQLDCLTISHPIQVVFRALFIGCCGGVAEGGLAVFLPGLKFGDEAG